MTPRKSSRPLPIFVAVLLVLFLHDYYTASSHRCSVFVRADDEDQNYHDHDDDDVDVVQWRSDVLNTGFVNVTLAFTDVSSSSSSVIETKVRHNGINRANHGAAKASPLTLRDGRDVLVAGDADVLYRVGLFDGAIRWAAARRATASIGFHSTPCVVYGVGDDEGERDLALIGSYDGRLTAFDLENGVEAWSTVVGQHVGASPTCTAEFAYISVEFSRPKVGGGVCKVRVADGSVSWCSNDAMGSHSHSTPAVDVGRGLVVAGSNDGKLHVFRERDGRPLAAYPLWKDDHPEETTDRDHPADVKGPILLWKGVAVFGSWAGKVHAVDLNGLVRRSDDETPVVVATERVRWWPSDVSSRDGRWVMSAAAIDPETELAYFGAHDGYLRCVDFFTGRVVWETKTTGHVVMSSPVVFRNAVVVGSNDGHVYAFDKADGAVLWSFLDGRTGKITSSVAASNDGRRLAFASNAYDYTTEKNCKGRAGAVHVIGLHGDDDDDDDDDATGAKTTTTTTTKVETRTSSSSGTQTVRTSTDGDADAETCSS